MNTARTPHRWRTLAGLRDVSASHLAGLASIGAALIHAAMVSGHAEQPTVARLFVAAAAAQLAAGLLSLLHGGRWAACLVALVNGGAVATWAMTRTSGISWIEGLEHPETPQFIDTVCAGLGALAVAGALCVLIGGRKPARHRLGVPALAVGALAVIAMMQGATQVHSHGDHDGVLADGHQHGPETVEHVETDQSLHEHPHVDSADSSTPVDAAHADGHHDLGASGVDDAHHATPSSAEPYDPTLPIDLSGVAGVTPEQQAFAENLVAVTVVRLPQWSDPVVAEAAGFRSIGDGVSGHEHYVQWDWIEDDVWLDPDGPESLVYEVQHDGTKHLVSAMYMLPSSMQLSDVPDYGGALMQWHIHDDLCLTADPEAPVIGGLTNPDGTCPSPLVKPPRWPMIHVWITPTPCGPFAALEGIAAGQVLPGEEHWCDHAHGS